MKENNYCGTLINKNIECTVVAFYYNKLKQS